MTSSKLPDDKLKGDQLNQIGFGGGCHWCTEAVFQHVEGVVKVEQGWIASDAPNDSFSEAVIVHYDHSVTLDKLIQIHLATHSSESSHSMRGKYRSSIYYFEDDSRSLAEAFLSEKSHQIITTVLPFANFKENEDNYLDYYRKNPDSPFCQRYIEPKLEKVKILQNK